MNDLDWRPVFGYEGLYSVSSRGDVRSEDCLVAHSTPGTMKRKRGKPLKTHPNRKGYLMVQLCNQGRIKFRSVHSLVLEAFVGPRPQGADACHNDSDPANNCASNLRWDTRAGNFSDKIANGTRRAGAEHPNSKLTDDDVRAIRADTRRLVDIARDFDTTVSNASVIRRREAWQHVSDH